MHDPSAEGADYFKCDFCAKGWSDDRPMVEGHKGSLVCGPCLRVARTALDAGQDDRDLFSPTPGDPAPTCVMCLEQRDEPMWRSPLREEAFICARCVDQAATTLARDPDFEWTL